MEGGHAHSPLPFLPEAGLETFTGEVTCKAAAFLCGHRADWNRQAVFYHLSSRFTVLSYTTPLCAVPLFINTKHTFSTRSSVGGHLVCFHFLAVSDCAA